MAKTETYEVHGYVCDNCDWRGSITVAKGKPRPDEATCPNCGCKTARKCVVDRIPKVIPYPVPYPVFYDPRPKPVLPYEIWCGSHTSDIPPTQLIC